MIQHAFLLRSSEAHDTMSHDCGCEAPLVRYKQHAGSTCWHLQDGLFILLKKKRRGAAHWTSDNPIGPCLSNRAARHGETHGRHKRLQRVPAFVEARSRACRCRQLISNLLNVSRTSRRPVNTRRGIEGTVGIARPIGTNLQTGMM